MHLGLAASPGPAVPPGCGAGSGATTVGPHVLIGPTYSHRSDHSSACDASIRPLTAGWRPALRARNRGWLPGPKPSLSPPLPPPAPHSTPGRRWQNPPTSSATAPPPAFLPPNPKCSSGSTGRPDPRPPSDGRDWVEAHLADPLLRHSLLPPSSDPAFPSAWPPVLPAPPSYPAAPGPATLSVSMSIHSSFQNCYASSWSISLAVLIAPQSALIIGSLSPSVIGDRPSHPIYRLIAPTITPGSGLLSVTLTGPCPSSLPH